MKIPVTVQLHGFTITWLKHVFVFAWGLERIREALPPAEPSPSADSTAAKPKPLTKGD